MKGFKEYYKNKYVWVFIALAIFYQVLMLGIFLPSYHHADENHAMTIAFIDNDESALSESVIAGIEESLPYEIKDLSKEEAQAAIGIYPCNYWWKSLRDMVTKCCKAIHPR